MHVLDVFSQKLFVPVYLAADATDFGATDAGSITLVVRIGLVDDSVSDAVGSLEVLPDVTFPDPRPHFERLPELLILVLDALAARLPLAHVGEVYVHLLVRYLVLTAHD